MTTWNPADKNNNIVLSNGDLTAGANNTAWKSVRGTDAKSNGKWYFEAMATTSYPGYLGIGVAKASESLTTYIGNGINGWGWYGNSLKTTNNIDTAWGTSLSSGQVVMIAIDLDNAKIWWGKDNVWFNSGNPATGINPAYSNLTGPVYPMASIYSPAESFAARFITASLSYPPPTGFLPWGNTLSISGHATIAAGGPVEQVVIRNSLTRTLEQIVVPDSNGDWGTMLAPGMYDITYFATGCQPICHGPYTVT